MTASLQTAGRKNQDKRSNINSLFVSSGIHGNAPFIQPAPKSIGSLTLASSPVSTNITALSKFYFLLFKKIFQI